MASYDFPASQWPQSTGLGLTVGYVVTSLT